MELIISGEDRQSTTSYLGTNMKSSVKEKHSAWESIEWEEVMEDFPAKVTLKLRPEG